MTLSANLLQWLSEKKLAGRVGRFGWAGGRFRRRPMGVMAGGTDNDPVRIPQSEIVKQRQG